MADGKLVAAGNRTVSIIAVPEVAPEQVGSPRLLSSFSTENDLARLLVADAILFAVTYSGKVMAFASRVHPLTQKEDADDSIARATVIPAEKQLPGRLL